jgi:hypothetical protein
MLNGHAPEAAAAAAAEGGKASQAQKRNAQVLRQRKASGKQQQQQQQQQQSKHQRPPIGPRSNSAAAPAGPAPQHKQGGQAAAAASRPKPAATGGPAAAKGGKAAGAGSMSPLQQRLGWLQDFFRQLFSGYGFITMELLRFVLGGLLPRRASLEQAPTAGPGRQQQQQQQQRRQQQQQQQRQQPWPQVGGGNSTLSALASVQGSQLLAAGLPPYLDLQVSGSSQRPSVADSLTDSSYPGSCRSECNMPWTPHPHLQQLYLQQQQQQQGLASLQFQQHHQHQQQQQPSRQNRLSSSSSSPSLHTAATAASRQPSPGAPGSNGVVDTGLERHATVPAAAEAGNYSLSGWSALQQQQQQQQGYALSRSDSTASCVTSQAVASSAAAGCIFPSSQVPDSMQGAFGSAPFLQQQQQQHYGIAAGPSVPLPVTGAAYSLPSPLATPLAGTPLPAHAASLGGPLGYGPLPDQAGGGLYDGSGSCWEGLGAGSPPGSTAGGTGAGSSSPSAVLFKGLLRGIVLYEGYRFVRVGAAAAAAEFFSSFRGC